MKRFDRAMYAIFLLALLADVARAHILVSVGGDASGGLILSVVSQLPVDPAGGAVLVPRRTDGSLPEGARFTGRSWPLSRWARLLRGQTRPARLLDSSNSVLLSAMDARLEVGPGLCRASACGASAATVGVFEHTGSPAP